MSTLETMQRIARHTLIPNVLTVALALTGAAEVDSIIVLHRQQEVAAADSAQQALNKSRLAAVELHNIDSAFDSDSLARITGKTVLRGIVTVKNGSTTLTTYENPVLLAPTPEEFLADGELDSKELRDNYLGVQQRDAKSGVRLVSIPYNAKTMHFIPDNPKQPTEIVGIIEDGVICLDSLKSFGEFDGFDSLVGNGLITSTIEVGTVDPATSNPCS